ncbi:MAG: bifunctional shikimate kinase/3-dehydroquinate synthase [Kiritimatiellae bacterium]|nr:bifunctional shikimate kinase/3-dehydroquinate synthase [Kiritimatiellia bacterium]
MKDNTLFLYGAPASGKTTLGRQLAERWGAAWVDLDERITASEGRDIPTIFAAEGEAGFRRIESGVLRQTLAEPAAKRVVSLGGGTLLDPENRALCEAAGTVVCLETPDAEELARRIGSAAGSRPLGDRAKARAPHYASFPNRLAAAFEAGPSLVVVGIGLSGALLKGAHPVADATVAARYRDRIPEPLATIPSGEEHKTPATVMRLWQAFARAGIGRRDTVTAVGGGVTGDLTGFAAATWMRGIDWINFPTTLLAMVDASTGGKTGCDLPEGKNLAGAFHPPRMVVIDTDFLKTLPAAILADGRAEMIKHEVIGGLDHADPPAGIPSAAEIARNLRVKVEIVREDPFEKTGRRVLLNCGHTVAHAVEQRSGYRLSHGSAVAIGCVAEARMAVRLGLAAPEWVAELAARFAAAGLPTDLPEGMTMETLVPVMKGDKKHSGSTVLFALPCGWGDVRAVPVELGKEGNGERGERQCEIP